MILDQTQTLIRKTQTSYLSEAAGNTEHISVYNRNGIIKAYMSQFMAMV